MIKAVIFDMDGVLVDSEVLKAESWKKVLEEYGVKQGDEWYNKKIGTPGKKSSQIAVKEFNLNLAPGDLFKKNRKIYLQILEKEKPLPIKPMVNFLKSIPKEKMKIAIASSEYAKIIQQQLKLLKIENYFDIITSGADETKNGKPHPEIYVLTAKKLKVNPEKCLVIEDSSPGVEAAKRAGMKCIGFRNFNSGNQDLSRADFIIKDPLQLNEILNNEK